MTTRPNLDALTDPKSIVVIGASATPSKLGHTVVQNLVSGGYSGRLYAVNRSGDDVGQVRGYSEVGNIPDPVDLAILAVPAPVVAEMLEAAGKAGVRAAIVIAAGFQEVGPQGAARESQLAEIADRYGMRLLGPNCLGLIDPGRYLNASFAPGMPPAGAISVLSQSGAMCTAILDWAKLTDTGFATFVSIGNKADVTENDFLSAWADDLETKVVLGYLEGVSDGPRFLEAAGSLTRQKPFVLIKAGVSKAGAQAVSSHTGSLTGADDVLDIALTRAGVTRAHSIEELFDYTTVFSQSGLPAGSRVAVITNAGGPGVITTDALAASSLEMATLSEKTRETLGKVLPAEASLANPIDLIGDARAGRYQTALTTILGDRGVDAVLVLLTPQAMTEIDQTANVITRVAADSTKPVIASFIGGQDVASGVAKLAAAKVPVYPTPDRAVKSLVALSEYAAYRSEPHRRSPKPRQAERSAGTVLKQAISAGQAAIWGEAAAKVVGPYGLDVPKSLLAHSTDEAATAAKKVGFPVVMKIDSEDVLHKSDVGGVASDLSDEAAVRKAYDEMLKRVGKAVPDSRLRGVSINQQVPDGLDVIVGAKHDPTFGPVVAFGFGGIFVELFHDVAIGLAPLTEREAEILIESTKAGQVIAGARGQQKLDHKAVRNAILAVSRLVTDYPMISEIDLNPLRVFKKGALSLDTRIILAHG